MICMDFETTDLLLPSSADIRKQPHATELCAIKFNKKFKEVDKFYSLIKPPVPIPPHIVKVTGISDETVESAPSFYEIFDELSDFFRGEKIVVGHNINFDIMILAHELRRINCEFLFPWPSIRHCTVELSFNIKNKRMKLGDLYEHFTGQRIVGAHRAENDVRANIICYKHLKKMGAV